MWPRLVAERPYTGRQQVLSLFPAFRSLPGAVLLDSGGARAGRFDLISALPVASLETRGEHSRMCHGDHVLDTDEDPFVLLTRMWVQHRPPAASLGDTDLPFAGGIIGAFAYDLGRRLERLPNRAQADLPFADLYAGLYHWAVIVDHEKQHCGLWQFAGLPAPSREQALTAFQAETTQAPAFQLRGDWRSNLSREHYGEAFRRVQDYIRAGDCYQINLAQRFSADFSGDSFAAYAHLSPLNKAPFSAYLEVPEGAILSLSPERFISVQGSEARTEPIKGTRPRSADPEEDAALADALKHSEKDRAENVMIVDLLRNDFGRLCTPGSVKVPELFTVKSYPAVHHLVSTVTGTLPAASHPLDLLRACFPGGSITGAPKIRAMEIIDELEPQRRSFYCGSIAFCDYHGRLDSSIAIRTLLCKRADATSPQRLHVWGGGGLVADSQEQSEYEETFAKLSKLLPPLRATLT